MQESHDVPETQNEGIRVPELRPRLEEVETKISRLSPGDGFILHLGDTGKTISGYVEYIGAGSATVYVTDRKARTIHAGEKDIAFTSCVGLQHWCLETLVVPDGTRHDQGDYQHKGESNMAKAKKAVAKKEGRKPSLAGFVEKAFSIFLNHGGKEYEAKVLASGMIEYRGKEYTSPSTVGTLICEAEVNGWRSWFFKKDGELVMLDTLRGKNSPLKPVAPPKGKKAKPAAKKAAKPKKVAGKAKPRKAKAEKVEAPATEETTTATADGEKPPF
jgi:hypothetical protein